MLQRTLIKWKDNLQNRSYFQIICLIKDLYTDYIENSYSSTIIKNTVESPLDFKEIKPVNPKGNQSWIFIGRTDVEAETPILWPPDGNNWLIWKAPDAGKDWRHEEKGMTEDEMVGWYHRVNGHEFEQTLGDGEGQWILVSCSPWGCQEFDTTERLKNNKSINILNHCVIHLELIWYCKSTILQ